SSRKTRSSGSGRKSGTTLTLPRGSSVYLVFALMDFLSFSPISRAEDSDDVVAVGKPDRKDAVIHQAEAVMPDFFRAVRRVFGDYAIRIGKRQLRHGKRNPVLFAILPVLLLVPFEPGLCHA